MSFKGELSRLLVIKVIASVWAMTDLITCNKKEASLTIMILILIRLINSVKILTH